MDDYSTSKMWLYFNTTSRRERSDMSLRLSTSLYTRYSPEFAERSQYSSRAYTRFTLKASSARRKEPLQLDLFEPRTASSSRWCPPTNASAPALWRCSTKAATPQEAMFAELKSQCGLGYAPSRKEAANRVFALPAVLAHNLGRELQMAASPPSRRTNAKRSPLWTFAQLRTMRNDFLLRAGRFVNSGQKRVLSIMNDSRTEAAMSRYLDALAT